MEGEKQESQKTVVAFIAGLLIGGLLVWIFLASSNSSDTEADMMDGDDTELVDTEDSDVAGDNETTTNTPPSSPSAPAPVVVGGNGDIAVSNQVAGAVVVFDDISYPTSEGWIVVHEDTDGSLGNALGASRYNTSVGLTPTRVELLRSTVAGSDYRIVFYSENGDLVFDLTDDVPLTRSNGSRIEATFTAQ